MNIGLLSILHNKVWDFRQDMAQTYANALKNAIELQLDNDLEKQHGYFLSKKGYKDKDGKTFGGDFEEKLYVGNIYRVENHLYYNDEELADDDQIINVVVVDGPITRDGGGCSYGSKDWRDQVMYANTIPQVVGHLFVMNTPGGEAAARNDYDMLINDCREKGKPTVAFVDGMCCSSGVNLASRCDRVIVMNPKDEFGCIGTMAAFWTVAHDTVDQDGYRYVELVGKDCPEKNAWWREAAKGEYEKLQADIDKDTEKFHNTVREGRPLVTDDMLSGKVFEAQEVIPALVDEIGDMERAIECVFALANEEMQAARFAVAEPGADTPGTATDEPVTGSDSYVAEHPEYTQSTHQKDNDMPEKEKMVDQTAEQPTTAQEQEAPTQEEQTTTEEVPATEEAPADEPATAEEPANEEPATAEEPAAEQPSEQTAADAQAELDKATETLHTAEAMIADKDKEIAELKESLATLQGIAEERDAANGTIGERDKTIEANAKTIAEQKETIDKLTKQVADLKAEVKELSEKETPMVDAAAGAPEGNATGDAPKQKQSKYHRGMSYKEYRQAAAGK